MGDIADCLISDELVVMCSSPLEVSSTGQGLSALGPPSADSPASDELVVCSSPPEISSPGQDLSALPGLDPPSAGSPASDSPSDFVSDLDSDSASSDDDNYFLPGEYESHLRGRARYQIQYRHNVAESPDGYTQSDHPIRQSIEGDDKLADPVEYLTIDPLLLGNPSELTHQRPAKTAHASSLALTGTFDVAEFVIRCSQFIDQQRPSRQMEGAELDWGHIGQFFCLPGASVRPPALSYLVSPRIGPSSAQQHQFWNQQQVPSRAVTFRSRLAKRKDRTEHEESVARFSPRRQAKPLKSCLAHPLRSCLALPKRVAEHAEYDTVYEIWCSHMLDWLRLEVRRRMAAAELSLSITPRKAERTLILRHHCLGPNGGINLAEFLVHPWSFSQTLENVAHLTLLARDGRVRLKRYSTHLATATPAEDGPSDKPVPYWPPGNEIIPMDKSTWRAYINFYDITMPMIPNRGHYPTTKWSV